MSRFCPALTPISIYESPIDKRGVRANREFLEGEIIEVCPCVRHREIPRDELADYVFSDGRGQYLMAYGLCSMYNHRDSPNASWQIMRNHQTGKWSLVVRAVQDISRNSEIFISYGPSYWASRPSLSKKRA